MFRYKADILPVSLIVGMFAIDLVIFFVAPWWVALAVAAVGLFPKFCVCAWNHHHQHVPTFHSGALNRALEVVYGMQTGVPPMGWIFHHNAGHHVNYMDQSRDESAWRTRSGRTMGWLEYSIVVTALAYPLMLRNLVRSTPVKRRPFYLWGPVYFLLVAFVLVWNPLNALFLFLVPMALGLFLTVWHTYAHHADLDTDDEYAASWNITHPVYNVLMGNLGYHTAHHVRCTVHWSELPAFHARIADRIPARLYREPVLPFRVLGALWSLVSPSPTTSPGPSA